MKLKGLNDVFRQYDAYQKVLASLGSSKTPCAIHGLSDSQKAYLSYCLFEDTGKQTLLIAHNDMEARKLYEDISNFTENCVFFPIKEMVFNVDVTSGEVNIERLKAIYKILKGKKLIVVSAIDSVFYRMTPEDVIKNSCFTIKSGDSIDILSLASRLIDLGYERVDIVEGRGQFAQRGGIIDIFPTLSEDPVRIEFFGDEVDTIRTFDVINQRSQDKIYSVEIYAAREVIIDKNKIPEIIKRISSNLESRIKILSKKNKDIEAKIKARIDENIEKLQNNRYFEGIDSFIDYIYKDSGSFIDYFKDPLVIIDESARASERINASFENFQEMFKSMLEKGEVLPLQGSFMLTPDDIKEKLNGTRLVTLNMLPRIIEDFKPLSVISFNGISMNSLNGNIEFLLSEVKSKIERKYRVIIMAGKPQRAERLADSLKDEGFTTKYEDKIDELKEGILYITPGSLNRGMEFPDIKLLVVSDKEVYKEKKQHKRVFTKKAGKIQSFTDIRQGDYVVHVNHGIGIYKGIKELIIDGIKKDYLVIMYQGGDTLYVPVEQLDVVQKYIGDVENPPKVNKLGGTEWIKTKKKVKESIKEMAKDLINLYAYRSTAYGHAFSKDTLWQKQFEDDFPYDETPDQLTSLAEIKKDMESPKAMDRLLCGDVGYGKTEVAMRAAFKCVMDGKQVAVLVPTTILAEQHYNNFKQRFADFPVSIDMISRFRNREEQKRTIKSLSAGSVDIIIGTHRIIQSDVKFKDLGLLIIDEEQRFGVSHKEKIKTLKKNVDVLTLTATPIPRTLHMSMIGVRDMSIIETPPEERYPVQTYVMEYNEGLIRDSIIREISRGGQVFFVYNRVETIKDMQLALSKLVPEARIVIAHGQMDEKELESVMLDFVSGEGDILLCTTIIETGIDMPNVNTLIVYDADRMGLSQLYQLRGRVGRSSRLAYAYFTYRKDKVLTEVAEKRLKAIKEFTEFGSGFKIAIRDLEIRGAGNLLGTQQHGHIAAVGYDLYCKLLSEAVNELKGEVPVEDIETQIDLPVNAYVPDNFIEDEVLKIEIYKKIASIQSKDDKMDIEDEITDRFGDMPSPLINLIEIAYIKSFAKKYRITSIKEVGFDIILGFGSSGYIDMGTIRELNARMNNSVIYMNSAVPSIKIKMQIINEKDPIKILIEFMENMAGLHNDIK